MIYSFRATNNGKVLFGDVRVINELFRECMVETCSGPTCHLLRCEHVSHNYALANKRPGACELKT